LEAGSIKGEWKGALTSRGTNFLARLAVDKFGISRDDNLREGEGGRKRGGRRGREGGGRRREEGQPV
jgi:hypothetical protein